MNIGFDLDKVLIKHPSSKLLERLHKKPDHVGLQYRIPSKLEQLVRILSHYRIFRPLHKENLTFIKDLARKNSNKHYLISGRYGFLQKRTHRLINIHGFDKIFDHMFFNFENKQPHIFKDDIIKKMHIDRYVDDDLDLLYYLAKHNPTTIFYWFNKKKSEKLKDNLFAITHLRDIVRKQ